MASTLRSRTSTALPLLRPRQPFVTQHLAYRPLHISRVFLAHNPAQTQATPPPESAAPQPTPGLAASSRQPGGHPPGASQDAPKVDPMFPGERPDGEQLRLFS